MKLPYVPIFVNDYLADTTHLKATANGAYWFLLLAYWKRGESLPYDERWLMETTRTTRKEWQSVAGPVLAFFVVDDDRLVHRRMEIELERAREKSENARASIQKRWEGR